MKKPQGFSALDRTAALTGGASSSLRVANASGWDDFDMDKLVTGLVGVGDTIGAILEGVGSYKKNTAASSPNQPVQDFRTPIFSQQKSNTGLWLMVGGGVLMLALVLVLVLRRK